MISLSSLDAATVPLVGGELGMERGSLRNENDNEKVEDDHRREHQLPGYDNLASVGKL